MHSVHNLSHQYGTKMTFKDVSVSIEEGECVALLGESGCGKSTLLRTIAGLENPTSGRVVINDQVVFSEDEICVPTANRAIGLVFQDYALFPSLTVSENIEFGITKGATHRVQELLKLIGMTTQAALYPYQLSGGQQQRVALARALAPKPKLLLLDEPFANVDAGRKMELGEELQRIIQNQGTSALFVTHDQQDALSLADKVAVMETIDLVGFIQQCDSPATVYRQPINSTIARLTGKANIVSGQALQHVATSTIGQIPLEREHNGAIEILIRPENISFQPGEGNATVNYCACLGSHFQISITIDDQQLWLYHPQALKKGVRGAVSIQKPCWFWP
jgi:iron(III) transport system ATP-binding protein